MTQDEILAMAREAGFPFNKYGLLQGDDEGEIDADEMFCVFAALVAAKEREACALLCDEAADALDRTGRRVNQVDRHTADVLRRRADAIRARGAK